MEKDKKRNILILSLIIIALVMIGFIIWWQFFRGQGEEVILNTNTVVNTNTNVTVVDLTNTNTALNTNQEVIVEDVLTPQRLASIYAERFGSYTSESDYQNTLDLKKYMTASLKQWADNYVATQQDIVTDGSYYAIVTKVIYTKILTDNDDDKVVEVLTQRTERGDNFSTENNYTQILELEMVRENDVWLVNKATWGDK